MKQLGRFLRLERERKDTEPSTPAPPRRFATLERAQDAGATAVPARHPSGSLERFSPEPDPPLVLEAPDTAQPFVRCVHCGADSSRHAMVCVHCEARLDTEDCRAFNARLWAEATAAREREAEELRRLEQGMATGVGPVEGEPVSAAELAARAEAQLELERLSRGSTPGWLRPAGLALGVGPLLVLAVALGIPGLLFALSHRGAFGTTVLLLGLGSLLLAAWRRAP